MNRLYKEYLSNKYGHFSSMSAKEQEEFMMKCYYGLREFPEVIRDNLTDIIYYLCKEHDDMEFWNAVMKDDKMITAFNNLDENDPILSSKNKRFYMKNKIAKVNPNFKWADEEKVGE